MCASSAKEDLEKYGYVRDDDTIELPEDRPRGKMVYFAGVWIVTREWVIHGGFSFPILLLPSLWLIFFYEKMSIIDMVLIMLVHELYFMFIGFLTWTTTYELSYMCKDILKKVLEGVADADLSDGDVAWRKIAYKANLLRSRYEPFYGGSHCRRVFVREVMKPVEANSYEICYKHSEGCQGYEDFCVDKPNKMLVQRAVNNYKKSLRVSETYTEDDGAEIPPPSSALTVRNFLCFLAVVEVIVQMVCVGLWYDPEIRRKAHQ
ncbi:hypothetical protein BZL39_A08940 [Zygosaccharomyces parabailii]|nr:hypothetical protein BZL39_A08940 [Zygosaccharomyces parabailii]CDH16862.1 uncharacterized protein ZBAI_08650 [Zygosaccharomyces bailii ISA1307]